jgi:hypothetical protein
MRIRYNVLKNLAVGIYVGLKQFLNRIFLCHNIDPLGFNTRQLTSIKNRISALETFLDAPVPYIMGLLRRTHDIELYKRGTVAIVDIDNGELVRRLQHEKVARQGCQMEYFHTKNTNLGGYCYGRYWSILWSFVLF